MSTPTFCFFFCFYHWLVSYRGIELRNSHNVEMHVEFCIVVSSFVVLVVELLRLEVVVMHLRHQDKHLGKEDIAVKAHTCYTTSIINSKDILLNIANSLSPFQIDNTLPIRRILSQSHLGKEAIRRPDMKIATSQFPIRCREATLYIRQSISSLPPFLGQALFLSAFLHPLLCSSHPSIYPRPSNIDGTLSFAF